MRIGSDVLSPTRARTICLGRADDGEEFYREATVWVDGLDRIHKHREASTFVWICPPPPTTWGGSDRTRTDRFRGLSVILDWSTLSSPDLLRFRSLPFGIRPGAPSPATSTSGVGFCRG